ncbi:MAG TPA: hypothetical protein VGG33_09820 [Polyangia bacterium]
MMSGGGGGGFAPPPAPVVVTDYDGGLGGDVGDARSTGMGASPVVGDQDAMHTARPDVNGRDSFVDRPAPPDVPMMVCSLLSQDCGLGRGCYLDASAAPACLRAGELGASAFCTEHRDCLPGLLCVEAFGSGGGRTCQPVCDPARGEECPGGLGCRKLAGTSAGFCEP